MAHPLPTPEQLLALLADPYQVADLPSEAVTALLGDLRRLMTHLEARQWEIASGNGAAQTLEGKQEQYLTIKDVADKTGMSPDYIYRHAPALGGFKIGSRWRFRKCDVERACIRQPRR